MVLGKGLEKWTPQWMAPEHKPKSASDLPHAQWVACWWARTLSQLTTQAASGSEATSVECLLTEFLSCNKIAVEDTCKVAWHFEAELWSNTVEKYLRKDPTCRPKEALTRVDEHRLGRARIKVATAQATVVGGRPATSMQWQKHKGSSYESPAPSKNHRWKR